MRNIELRQLRYFSILAKELHFGRAAELAFVTQSALSQQIAKLEELVGFQLLTRDRRGVNLTPSGVALLEGAEKVFTQIERSLKAAREAATDNEFKLSFGLVEYTNLRFIPPALIRLQALYPDVKIIRREMNTLQQVAALRANEIDVGFGALLDSADTTTLTQATLLSSDWVLLMPKGHRLAELPRLRIDDLASERLIIFERSINMPLYDGVVAACVAAGFKPNFVYETSQAQIGMDLVEQGLGVMLGTTYVFATHPEALVYRPVDGFKPLVIDVLSRAGERNTLVLDFIELATEEALRTNPALHPKPLAETPE